MSESEIENEHKFQWNVLIFSIMASMIICLSYLTLVNYIDANKYYVYYGSSGPYQATQDNIEASKLNLALGKATNIFKPGDWVGYINDMTIERDVAVKTTITLVNSKNETFSREELNVVLNGERRTGPKNIFFHLPANLPDGDYELKRLAVFSPEHGVPVSQSFQPIEFKVIQK